MKYFLLSIICLLLSSCYYSDGCIISPQMVNCYFREKQTPYPIIAGYQNKNSIGHTDSKQRLKDIKACGSDENLFFKLPSDYEKFSECLTSKGYIYIEPNDCGYQEPKWSTGKCNL